MFILKKLDFTIVIRVVQLKKEKYIFDVTPITENLPLQLLVAKLVAIHRSAKV